MEFVEEHKLHDRELKRINFIKNLVQNMDNDKFNQTAIQEIQGMQHTHGSSRKFQGEEASNYRHENLDNISWDDRGYVGSEKMEVEPFSWKLPIIIFLWLLTLLAVLDMLVSDKSPILRMYIFPN